MFKFDLGTNAFPSLDSSYFKRKYSGLSTKSLLNVWATFINKGSAQDESNQKVFYFLWYNCASHSPWVAAKVVLKTGISSTPLPRVMQKGLIDLTSMKSKK